MTTKAFDPMNYIHNLVSSETLHPDGTRDVERAAAIWVLAHRGYSGMGRLDVWLYPSKKKALRAGAKMALDCGLSEDEKVRDLYARGKHEKVMEAYEQTSPDSHVLRVVAAWFLDEDD